MKIITIGINGEVFDNATIEQTDDTLTLSFDTIELFTEGMIKTAFGNNDPTKVYRIYVNDDSADNDTVDVYTGYTRIKSVKLTKAEDVNKCTVVLRKPTMDEFMVDVYGTLDTILTNESNIEMAAGGAYADFNSSMLNMMINQLGGN